MITEFLAFVEQNALFSKDDNILLAVSGGIDSVVMMHLFASSGFRFAVAHCNFKLRGQDADDDEKFVEKLCRDHGVKFYSKAFDTKKYATENGLSTQLAARELRYAWFEELLEKEGFDFLSVAHHLNDSLETAIYNLTKGTGLAGLKGISVKNDYIVRPMLFAKREQVEAYAKAQGITWREDASNQSDDYSRNLIRNRVLPILKEINPSIEKTFKSTEKRIAGSYDVLMNAVNDFKKKHVKKEGVDLFVNKEALRNVNIVVLDELIKPFGFNFSQVNDIYNSLEGEGKVFDSETHRLNIDRESVLISPVEAISDAQEGVIEDGQSAFSNGLFSLQLIKSSLEGAPVFKEDEVLMDYEALEFPLKVRKWQEGDAFYPLGMSGKKKLSDFMIDNKIPLNLKARVYVVESAGAIAWVIGYRLDDRFKVRSDSKHTLKFRLSYHD